MTESSMPRRWVLALALAGTFVVTALAAVVLRPQSSGIDDLRREVDALRSARPPAAVVRELRTVVREPAALPTREDGGPATVMEKLGAETQPALTPEEAQHRADVIVAAREKTLGESFARETSDPDWSQAATAALRSAYSGEGFEALRIDCECRATLCRVSFAYTNADGELQSRNFAQRMPWRGALNSNLDAEARRGTFYLARQGFALPDVDLSALEF